MLNSLMDSVFFLWISLFFNHINFWCFLIHWLDTITHIRWCLSIVPYYKKAHSSGRMNVHKKAKKIAFSSSWKKSWVYYMYVTQKSNLFSEIFKKEHFQYNMQYEINWISTQEDIWTRFPFSKMKEHLHSQISAVNHERISWVFCTVSGWPDERAIFNDQRANPSHKDWKNDFHHIQMIQREDWKVSWYWFNDPNHSWEQIQDIWISVHKDCTSEEIHIKFKQKVTVFSWIVHSLSEILHVTNWPFWTLHTGTIHVASGLNHLQYEWTGQRVTDRKSNCSCGQRWSKEKSRRDQKGFWGSWKITHLFIFYP